jgi:citrate lyase subunit beta/citryl-CoA lyase
MRPTDWAIHPLRSLLFAPGNHPRRLQKVGSFGSDVIVLDLEDAVADSEKDSAREFVRNALPSYDQTTMVTVRVNGQESGRMEDDLKAVVRPELDCVMIPKLESRDTLRAVDLLLTELERELGIREQAVRILGLIETAKGLTLCEEIAASGTRRLLTLVFGLADFSVDVGVDVTPAGTELLYARSRIVVATRAAGLGQPIEGPYLNLEDMAGLIADCRRSRGLGFQGRVVIYPPHVAPVQRAYSHLDDDDAERCRRIVEGFEAAEAAGSASVRIEGRFVDYPIYHRAKEKLRRYEAPHSTSTETAT